MPCQTGNSPIHLEPAFTRDPACFFLVFIFLFLNSRRLRRSAKVCRSASRRRGAWAEPVRWRRRWRRKRRRPSGPRASSAARVSCAPSKPLSSTTRFVNRSRCAHHKANAAGKHTNRDDAQCLQKKNEGRLSFSLVGTDKHRDQPRKPRNFSESPVAFCSSRVCR